MRVWTTVRRDRHVGEVLMFVVVAVVAPLIVALSILLLWVVMTG